MDVPVAAPPPVFKDRKVGLIIFGILTILGGCVCGLFVLLILAAPALAAQSPNPPPVSVSRLPALMYAALGVTFIWLGIGSVMARRWARALLVVISWSFVVCGVLGLLFLGLMAPHLNEMMGASRPANQTAVSDSAQAAVLVVMFLVMAIVVVVGPLMWALFYSGRNVKATCEALDPTPRWTDRCPLQVLAISIWLFFGGVTMLMMSALYPVAPFFGKLLTGGAAVGYHFFLACIWIYAAWALYRLNRSGWWLVFVVMIAVAISGVITFWLHTPSEMYALLGYSKEMLVAMDRLGSNGRLVFVSSVMWTVPLLAYLLYVRKYLSRPMGAPPPLAG